MSPRDSVSFNSRLVHHDDAEREYAYDRGSKIGGPDKALDEAENHGWTVVSMQKDWRTALAALSWTGRTF